MFDQLAGSGKPPVIGGLLKVMSHSTVSLAKAMSARWVKFEEGRIMVSDGWVSAM
jgi:hypothetical protein